ncbi:putative ABC transporter permease [Clostridium folliculivorans]|uniref:Membrane protein n=1 Tax=Clostridium folliculivorans TaxID=2886038 RepID=A0A9W5Y161_9CLOT|nr:putative ABC transporter permease [Clostridium folliculivorans]GKU24698.1 membrane protein [Clostridium folliculivorans]GKU30796.1 membrane protein [Clostridium folliculivorans]
MSFFISIGFNFIIYSFLGWIIENLYCYHLFKRFQEDGFLYGPYKPMYGFAFSILVLLNDVIHNNIILALVICLIIPTTIEYLSGYYLKKFFNKTYWDYSNERANYNGLVCAKFSFYWMILSLLGMFFIHPIINKFFLFYKDISFVFIILILLSISMDLFMTIATLSKENKLFKKF